MKKKLSGYKMKELIAHELGHAICSKVQDNVWKPIDITLVEEDGAWAACNFDKLTTKNATSYKKIDGMVNLGGIYGELLFSGKWSPWGARCDVDEFITANERKNDLKVELDNWLWIADDDLSFRSCSSIDNIEERRKFRIDCHETARRLPNLWEAYLDFCDKIDKKTFLFHIEEMASSSASEITNKELREIIKEVVL